MDRNERKRSVFKVHHVDPVDIHLVNFWLLKLKLFEAQTLDCGTARVCRLGNLCQGTGRKDENRGQ